ncbi:hypothetical protein [Janthinobacterium sp.]|uniref:hypothetical protein n=1 Tax=Janthinobacterium sp. TaxID=1871054 RepID=UPI00262B7339|nr:hypothetical protein [Janthinobacterium sp.]
MKKRGKILRDTSIGPGLLAIGLEQYPFQLEGMWKSDTAPKVNMVVEVEFDEGNAVSAIYPVADTQLAKEQAELAMSAARAKGAEVASGVVARLGVPMLVSLGLLVIGWFFLNAISVRVSSNFNPGLSFWKLLALLNSPSGLLQSFGNTSGSSGIYGFLAIVCLAGPLLPHVWKDKRAHLGGLLPLLFMLLVVGLIYSGISNGISEAQGAASQFGGAEAARMMAEMSSGMAREALRAISIGLGAYLSLAASLYLAGRGTIKFLAAKAV